MLRYWTLAIASTLAVPAGGALCQTGAPAVADFVVEGDAIPRPLTAAPADAARGRTIVLDPERGNCTICHAVPGLDARFLGNLAPTLAGVGQRLSAGQIRLRLVDGTRLNRSSIMPPYHRVEGLNRVAQPFQRRPVLAAAEIEDVVAYLLTLE